MHIRGKDTIRALKHAKRCGRQFFPNHVCAIILALGIWGAIPKKALNRPVLSLRYKSLNS